MATAAIVAALPGSALADAAAVPGEAQVVGGADAMAGKWPDAVAVYVANVPICTGVLVAPTVVLTAAHCNSASLNEVLIGADTLAAGNQGERVAVARRIEYPSWDTSFDALVLVLARPSSKPPRTLASGWASLEVTDGAEVSVVGFGAVDADGTSFVDPLQEGVTTITDATCKRVKGCNPDAQPDGELGAGGMGVDSCSGDSGGPLYVVTSMGTFLAGLTSRSYDDATQACSQGGIYTRPDKIVGWIEEQAGVAVHHGPEPSFDALDVAVGHGAEVQLEANDPKAARHHFQIVTPPKRGSAAVDDEGRLRMCATGDGPGADAIVVAITDVDASARRLEVTVPVTIRDGTDDGGCEFELDSGGCGCRSGQDGAGARWLPLAAAVLLLARRRSATDRARSS